MEEEKKKKGKGKVIGIIAIVVIVLIAIGACSGSDEVSSDQGDTSTDTSAKQEEKAPEYAIEGEELVDEGYGFCKITGTLTNNSGSDKEYVQVEYVLKDADGAQIGTALANTNNLADVGVWKFEAVGSVSGDGAPASFERADVTGF